MLLSQVSRHKLDADSRDAYGFTIRPQHRKIYQEYGHIYTEEEEERLEKWRGFLELCGGSEQLCSSSGPHGNTLESEGSIKQKDEVISESCQNGYDSSAGPPISTDSSEDKSVEKSSESFKVQVWNPIRSSLAPLDVMMGARVKKTAASQGKCASSSQKLHSDSAKSDSKQNEVLDQSIKEPNDFCKKEDMSDISCQEADDSTVKSHHATPRSSFHWEELESLVRGGVPKSLRGEVWQVFAGVTTRRVDRYYQNLVSSEIDPGDKREPDDSNKCLDKDGRVVPDKLKRQIEKDLGRTFPGHPALDEEGRNSLRRVLIAYAHHNPSVGYCQAMNFFAGLFLLMMPEENAFWTLVGVIDDYFEGYYTYDMIESQVDQLVFEDLMRETFPKLVNHLDHLGVQVTWIASPWFLSIFMNMLPWESVLRVWDVLLFEGNRVMLFRTALALMELYGHSLITCKDASDAITLLQSLAGSTFDSSQLVITACMSFLSVTEARLQALRNKHRPSVLGIIKETTMGNKVSKESKTIATKLYNFKRGPQGGMKENKGSASRPADKNTSGEKSSETSLYGLDTVPEEESLPDLQEQMIWLKVGMCQLLEERRVALLRAEELETAFMEMVKQDNRRLLSARVEQLEQEVSHLQQTLADKLQQEKAMLQVLMHMEQEQKETEEARVAAEKEAENQKYAAQFFQEKYESTVASMTQMEERVIMAESMLEATIQYESSQSKALTPRTPYPGASGPLALKTGMLPFGMGWIDKSKAKSMNGDEPGSSESTGSYSIWDDLQKTML